ncbi:MAG TPA: hypothetical protein VFU47_11630 [Armatimonadota bacterium]|nr:hypothetical protein [Armatimonadota bacterium]
MSDLLREIGERVASEAEEAYFVGGCVRDFLRGDPGKDLDFVLRGDPHAVGRALARAYNGPVFWLRQEDEVVRVLLPEHGGLQIDLLPLRSSLEEDLLARDLTINAMAVPAETGLGPDAPVIDPSGGRADLAQQTIRFVRPAAPEKDPLRTLRALRFRWKLGFELAPGTEERIRECVPLLQRVSTERIRDELFQLLAMECAAQALAECLRFGTVRWLTGCSDAAVAARAEAGAPADSARSVAGLIQDGPPDLSRLLSAEVTPPRTRRQLLLWAAALQPLPELDPAAAARYLALSNEERDIIAKGLAAAREARELARRWPQPGRLRLRLFQKAGPVGAEAVLLAAAADGWSDAYRELLGEALRRHFWPEPPLLSGVEVMQLLRLSPGPAVGRALAEVEEARADGLIRSPQEAVRWLRERARAESAREA